MIEFLLKTTYLVNGKSTEIDAKIGRFNEVLSVISFIRSKI